MIINEQSLAMLTQAVQATFLTALGRAKPQFGAIAMTVPSVTAESIYPYLRDLGSIRQWVGDRVIQNMAKGEFRIANVDYEQTQAIPRKAVEDDQYGMYSHLYDQMGQNVALFPDKQCFSFLKTGFTTIGPDGQYFFDVDHPVGRPGSEASVSNFMGGSGEAWYVVDSTKSFKPVIWQPRKDFGLQTFFDPKDQRVFWNKEYVWGVDGRSGVGFSPFWQLCFASKQTPDATAVRALLTAMAAQKNDAGDSLDIQGDTVICSPNLQEQMNDLFNKATLSTGETNTLNGRLKVVVSGRLL